MASSEEANEYDPEHIFRHLSVCFNFSIVRLSDLFAAGHFTSIPLPMLSRVE